MPKAAGRLSPVVRFEEGEFVVFVGSLETLPNASLSKRLANLMSYRLSLLAAIDLLFYGI